MADEKQAKKRDAEEAVEPDEVVVTAAEPEQPAVDEPAVEQPVAEAEEQAAEEPLAEGQAVEEPVAVGDEQAAEEPVAEAEEPAVEEPAAATEEPVTEEEPEAEAAVEETAAEDAAAVADEAAVEADEAPAAVTEEPAVEAPPTRTRSRKRLPRALRHKHSKPKREPSKTRKPITRIPKPEGELGRRQERRGVVVSDKGDKTIVVKVSVTKAHPKYKKVVRRTRKFHAHDEENAAAIGDVVRIIETRPLSKTKHWRLAEIVERAR